MNDLKDIRSFIAKDSESQARRGVDKIWNSTRRIEHFPEIGAVVLERNDPTLREILVYRYRVFYRIYTERNLVRIIAVIHGARQLTDEMIGE